MLFGCLLIFFENNFLEKLFQECHQCQIVWIQIRPDIWSGLIWVQTVCNGYQMEKVAASKKRFNCINIPGRIKDSHFGKLLEPLIILPLYLLVSSADNLCKQFGPRSGPTKYRA